MRRLFAAASLLAVSVVVHAAPPAAKGGAAGAPPQFTLKPAVKGKAPESKYGKDQVKRGEYLVRYGGCDDCHTPKMFDQKANMPVPQMDRRLSGHPEGAPDPISSLAPGDSLVVGATFTSFKTPFGTAYAANLTPDLETGSGQWTEEQFVKIFRTGKHLGNGRPIMPPMPWASLARLTDDDMRAIFAFTRSLQPVKNKVPQIALPDQDIQALDKVNSMMLAP
jgi:hypothetical protein